MACACKVNKDIAKLQYLYGVNKPSKETHIREKFEIFLNKMLIGIIMIPLMPFLFLMILYKIIIKRDKVIQINDVLKFKHVK